MPVDPLLGEIAIYPYNFPPRGWAYCNGQIMAISDNTALFSLLSTNFGGDGRSSFGIPDLRGRTPVGVGLGTGLTNIFLGQLSGEEYVKLGIANLPIHTHSAVVAINPASHSHTAALYGEAVDATSQNPSGKMLAKPTSSDNSVKTYVPPDPKENKEMMSESIVVADTPLTASAQVDNTGGGLEFYNRNPFLGLHYCIAVVGTYPSRN